MKILSLIAMAVLTAAPSSAGRDQRPLWSLAECSGAEHREAVQLYRASVEKAKPGGEMYTPHPFPERDAEAIDIYLDLFSRRLKRGTEKSIRMEESLRDKADFLALVADGDVEFNVARVAQWREKFRCSRMNPSDYSFLVRGFLKDSGREIFRGTVDEAGLPGVWSVRLDPEQLFLPMDSLEEGEVLIRKVNGDTVSRTQYLDASSSGGRLCDYLAPCVATLGPGDVAYILQAKGLSSGETRIVVKIPPTARRAAGHQLKESRDLVRVGDEPGRVWISGGGLFVLGEVIAADFP